ncbi:unnamed protein product, partial [Prorocentrum cordatum]
APPPAVLPLPGVPARAARHEEPVDALRLRQEGRSLREREIALQEVATETLDTLEEGATPSFPSRSGNGVSEPTSVKSLASLGVSCAALGEALGSQQEPASAPRPCLQSSRSTGSCTSAISAAAVAFSILGHALCYACAGAGEDAQEIVACSSCGAYKVLGSHAGAKPRLKEQCPGDKRSKADRNQRSLWERGLHPGGHAQERYLEWLGIEAESAVRGDTEEGLASRVQHGDRRPGEPQGQPPSGAARPAVCE